MDDSRHPSLGRTEPDRDTLRAGRARFSRRCAVFALLAQLALIAPAAASAADIQVKPSRPPHPRVGEVWSVRVTVPRSKGETTGLPTLDIRLLKATGERIDVQADQKQQAGKQTQQDVYTANIAFPSQGSWRYIIEAGNPPLESKRIAIGPARSPGSSWKIVALVASGIALLALVALPVGRRRRPKSVPQRRDSPPAAVRAPPPQPAPPPSDEAREDREALIRSCVYLYDIIHEPALRDRLRDALAEAGVVELDSAGGPFDPTKHKATGRVPTADPSLDGRIAAVERPGFADRGRVFRLPEVTVYSAASRKSGG
jgi:molecular chaperone GrpE